jgi:SAM-dependent methyltransferase
MAAQDDWYDSPLYYDIIFDGDTAREADFLEAMLDRHGPPPARGRKRRILEPACGSGRLVAELAARRHRVAGFDLNPHMLAFARERLKRSGLHARLSEESMQSFTIHPTHYDLAHCLVSTFKYLLTESDAHSHLARVATSLRPGGLYLLGLHLTADYSRATCQHERWVAERDGVGVVCNTRTWPPDRKTRREAIRNRLTIHDPSHAREHTLETRWQFRTYNSAQLKRLLRSVPALECIATHDFWYEADSPRPFDDSREDIVLVLRRKPT